MKVKVDLKQCIGCGVCSDVAEEVFEMRSGVSVPKNEGEVSESRNEAVRMASECCPVQAIKILD